MQLVYEIKWNDTFFDQVKKWNVRILKFYMQKEGMEKIICYHKGIKGTNHNIFLEHEQHFVLNCDRTSQTFVLVTKIKIKYLMNDSSSAQLQLIAAKLEVLFLLIPLIHPT